MAERWEQGGPPAERDGSRLLAQSARGRARDRKRGEAFVGVRAFARQERYVETYEGEISSTSEEKKVAETRAKTNKAASYIQKHFRLRFYRFDRELLIERLQLERCFHTIGARFIIFMSLFVLVFIFASAALDLDSRFTRLSIHERLSPEERLSASSVPEIRESLSILHQALRRFQPFSDIPSGKLLEFGSPTSVPALGDGTTFLAASDGRADNPILEALDSRGRACFRLSDDGFVMFNAAGNVSINHSLGDAPPAGTSIVVSLDTQLIYLGIEDSPAETWPVGTELMGCFIGNSTLRSENSGGVRMFPRRIEPSAMASLVQYGYPIEDFISGRDLEGSEADYPHEGIHLLGPPVLAQHIALPMRQYCDGVTKEVLGSIEDQWLASHNHSSSFTGLSSACQPDDGKGDDVVGYLREIEIDPHTVDSASSDVKLLAPFYSQPGEASDKGLLGLLVAEWPETSEPGRWRLYTVKKIATGKWRSSRAILSEPLHRIGVWVTTAALAYVTCFYVLAIDFTRLLRRAGSRSIAETAVKALYFELDIVVSILVMVTLTLGVSYWAAMPSVFDATLDELLQIPWTDGTVPEEANFAVLHRMADQIIKYHRLREWLEFAVQISLYSILARMVSSMSAHPRIALFADTLRSAQSEIVHFSISFAVLYFGLGLIAWLTFGGLMDEFTTYPATLWTQFYILSSGQWFDAWENDWFEPAAKSNIVMLKVRNAVENHQTAQSIIMETIDYYASKILWSLWGLPRRGALIEALQTMSAKKTVDLRVMLRANMFTDLESATRFCQFYRRYDSLKPRGVVTADSDKWEGIVNDLDEQVNRAADHNERIALHQANVVERLDQIESTLQNAVSTLEVELGLRFTSFVPPEQPPPTINGSFVVRTLTPRTLGHRYVRARRRRKYYEQL
ncbi:hypothetical protein FOZ60_004351 [Perkinsus olseni]|uniref:Polycystin cation channel PKD1/PKD2 domain-containing protein n=1 Tax=Perkinsus olseni TaxID=32597 RepID=A0A7J6NTX9_PEROL|nr:hypothetical protein FOZ60_004351 [Perkinsus olseni]